MARSTDYRPVKFLDGLEGNRHVVMLYDDDVKADMMIARYFQNGLDAGGSCVFLADEGPKAIERRLGSQGIDVDRYVKESRFRTFHPSPGIGKTDVLRTQRAMIAESTKGMKPPLRFAGRTIPDIESVNGMRLGMRLEKTGQEHFEEFDISLLCFYDVRKLESSRRDEWVMGLLKNHHQVIYASDSDKAVGFETSLLEEDEK
jgi:hypothetical protein